MVNGMYRIWIVEDDLTLARQLTKRISKWDCEVRTASDFRNITEEFEAFSPHLVLMDIRLPFFSGYYWCAEIRKKSNVPVIFLSSAADSMNIVMAMNMGGDDFIAKPVDGDVLDAKLQAMLRRVYAMNVSPVREIRGICLDTEGLAVECGGERVGLTRNEFIILRTLLENAGKLVTRDTLMMKLWQDDCYVEENTLTVNVTRLRKKLEAAGLSGFITTKVGSGYIIE